MKKKRLSQRQLERIRRRQEALADSAGQEQPVREEASAAGLGAGEPGVVISHFGQQIEIEALEGDRRGQMFRCHQRGNLEPLVAGDRVLWRPGEPVGVVEALLPRRNLLSRPSPFTGLRPVAANIDNIAVVIAPVPQPFANLIDRYLVAGEHMGVSPVLVLNKLDLLDALEPEQRAGLGALLALYEGIGYRVLRVSSKTGTGLDDLREALKAHTSIFVGQSGVGKSALVNALLPGVNTLEGELSGGEIKGRHTTTAARLFHFPEGGDLIDSPGIREFGLGHLEPEQLLAGFVEFRPFLDRCRFRDCKHGLEPGCRLREALERGEISPARMDSYLQILQSQSE